MVPLMSLACKSQNLIVMRDLELISPVNTIFLFIVEAKAC
jgi:hypothetical protein